jgi:glycosyltransferase involved in cell wall biosynthesis
MERSMAVPLLIALPHGLGVSGVNVWAVRLAGALALRGTAAALLHHAEPNGHDRVDLAAPPEVAQFDLGDLPPLDAASDDISPWVGRYRDAVRRLADRHGSPVVVSPNLLGGCYGIVAALCQDEPESVRVVGWVHSPIDYNYWVAACYETIIGRFVGVSDRIESTLRARLGHRGADVVNIPYGVPVTPEAPRREPLAGRAVRLIYTGRIDHHEKRIMALAHLGRELARRGVDHELVVIGDGPAATEFDSAIAGVPTVRRLPPASPDEVGRWLERSDALLLASRYEGLSVSMLEAMGRGCVPVVTRVESGVGQAIEEGINGELADVSPHDDEPEVAVALADAVERFVGADNQAMAAAAWRRARDRFSIERHAEAVEAMMREVAAEPARAWPVDRPFVFDVVPSEGKVRMASLLETLAGRQIVVHGTGKHTSQLVEVMDASRALIVAFADDDRQRHGSTLWRRPVISPSTASGTGATDVIISSWINQDTIWSHRDVYESQGLTVHRLY